MSKRPNRNVKPGTSPRCTYTKAKAEQICAAIAEGKGLATVAREMGLPRRTVQSWIDRYATFRAAYTAACEQRLLYLEDRLLELCKMVQEQVDIAPELAKARHDACKLEIDTLKWLLCKLVPKRYGDKTQMEVTGKDGAQLIPQRTKEEMAQFAAMVAAARAKTPNPHETEAAED